MGMGGSCIKVRAATGDEEHSPRVCLHGMGFRWTLLHVQAKLGNRNGTLRSLANIYIHTGGRHGKGVYNTCDYLTYYLHLGFGLVTC